MVSRNPEKQKGIVRVAVGQGRRTESRGLFDGTVSSGSGEQPRVGAEEGMFGGLKG